MSCTLRTLPECLRLSVLVTALSWFALAAIMVAAPAAAEEAPSSPGELLSLDVQESGVGMTLALNATERPNCGDFTITDPPTLVISCVGMTMGKTKPVLKVGNGVIERIEITESSDVQGVNTEIQILMTGMLEYDRVVNGKMIEDTLDLMLGGRASVLPLALRRGRRSRSAPRHTRFGRHRCRHHAPPPLSPVRPPVDNRPGVSYWVVAGSFGCCEGGGWGAWHWNMGSREGATSRAYAVAIQSREAIRVQKCGMDAPLQSAALVARVKVITDE